MALLAAGFFAYIFFQLNSLGSNVVKNVNDIDYIKTEKSEKKKSEKDLLSLEKKDTDKDGLNDLYEQKLFTDKTKIDSDGDGVSDYMEVLNNTNPTGNEDEKKNPAFRSIREKLLNEKFFLLREKSKENKEYKILYTFHAFGGADSKNNGYPNQEIYFSAFDEMVYRDGDNYLISAKPNKESPMGPLFFLGDKLVNSLDSYYYNGEYYKCSAVKCFKEELDDYFFWKWNFLSNPNFIYPALGSKKLVDFKTDDKDNCDFFVFKVNKIQVPNIEFLNDVKRRKGKIKVCIDEKTGIIKKLLLYTVKKIDGNEKEYPLLSWDVKEISFDIGNINITPLGKYSIKQAAWDKNNIFVIVEPLIDFDAKSVKFYFYPKDGSAEKKEIDLLNGKKYAFKTIRINYFDVKHNLNSEKILKTEICIDDNCEVVFLGNLPSGFLSSYNCLKKSPDKDVCDKDLQCYFNEKRNLCLGYEGCSFSDLSKEQCLERNCRWRDDFPARCFDK